MNSAVRLFRPVNSLQLALAHIRATLGGFVANALLLAMAVASLIFLAVAASALQSRAVADAKGVDLVVGAKGSPLQIVLASLYHVDISPGNIPKKEADELAKHPMIASAVPLSLGDNYRGFRIVGTDTAAYAALYGAVPAQGALPSAPMQAVVGAQVAARAKLTLDSRFAGAHGLAEGGAEHKDEAYTVSGVLAPTGTVLDRLILTPLESVWLVHEEDAAQDADKKTLEAEREYSALLIRYRTPIAAATLPRAINASSKLQAASPAFESARLFRLLEPAILLMQAFAALLAVAALVSIGLATTVSLRERRMDAAVLRLMGASQGKLLAQFGLEALLLGAAGALLGLAVALLVLHGTAAWLAGGQKILIPELTASNAAWLLALLALPVAVLAALLPALKAARVEPAKVLAER
jgi:putative ABC transport system permease protein